MESLDTFTQLPLQIDPSTKAISASSSPLPSTLQTELKELNYLHRSLLTLDSPHTVPPPPLPVNPKRSAQIAKLRESGNDCFRRNKHADATRMYTLAIEMAGQRPLWEPSGLMREELAVLYCNRSQAFMALREWPQGAVDAGCSVELKRVQNGKGWWRRGKCLLEMGRLDEAAVWVKEALNYEGQEADLVKLAEEVGAAILKKEGK